MKRARLSPSQVYTKYSQLQESPSQAFVLPFSALSQIVPKATHPRLTMHPTLALGRQTQSKKRSLSPPSLNGVSPLSSSSKRAKCPVPPHQESQKARSRRVSDALSLAYQRAYTSCGMSATPLPPLFGVVSPPPSSSSSSSSSSSFVPNNNSVRRISMPCNPYGIRPYGNIVDSPVGDIVRTLGLGTRLSVLNDYHVLDVLRYLDARSLARTSSASRFLYAATHGEQTLWRDLLLRRLNKDDGEGEEDKDNLLEYSPGAVSWKDVLAYNFVLQPPPPSSFVPHVPLVIANVYSDALYRPFLCACFEPPLDMFDVSTVDSIDVKDMTYSRFVDEYERPNRPLVIRNATKSWPAVSKWSPEYLMSVCGVDPKRSFRSTSGGAPLSQRFAMSSYLAYATGIGRSEESPLYLFERDLDRFPELLSDYQPALRESLPYLAPTLDSKDAGMRDGHASDLLHVLGPSRRPDHKWLIIGPSRSGSSFHIDPNATNAWNAPLRGNKRWIFYPPGVTPPGVFVDGQAETVVMPVSLGEWVLSFWNSHVAERRNPDKSLRPLECGVSPGDILFVPHGWWHSVFNIKDPRDSVDGSNTDDGVTIALTQNYASTSNLGDVFRFLEKREGQISGLRDRVHDGAVKPEELLGELKKSLREKGFGDVVDKGEADAKAGWGCAAWKEEEEEGEECKRGRSVLDIAKSPGQGGGG